MRAHVPRAASLFAAGFLAFAVATPVQARVVTDAERAALTQTVEGFEAAMRSHGSEAVVDVVPPKIIAHIAETHGLTAAALHASMVKQMTEILDGGTIASFRIDMADAKAASLADGSPYLLIPTETILSVKGQKVRAHAMTLALMDEGRWYLVRVSTPAEVERLVAVYPGFAGIDFGHETSEVMP